MHLMDTYRRAYRVGAKRSLRRAAWRRVVSGLTTVSLLPLLLLGPLGPGTIVIHDHHEEELHAHRVCVESGGRGAAGSGHDHPTESAVDLEGMHLVLTLPDLPRLSTHVQASGFQMKPPPPPVAVTSILAQNTALTAVYPGANGWPAAPLRARDTITGLLLSGHSLLI